VVWEGRSREAPPYPDCARNHDGIPRNRGIDADGIGETEADYFGNCPVCGALIDMRDLGQILAHMHDAEIEVGEGNEPPSLPARRIRGRRDISES
jgi:hypothetical protein